MMHACLDGFADFGFIDSLASRAARDACSIIRSSMPSIGGQEAARKAEKLLNVQCPSSEQSLLEAAYRFNEDMGQLGFISFVSGLGTPKVAVRIEFFQYY